MFKKGRRSRRIAGAAGAVLRPASVQHDRQITALGYKVRQGIVQRGADATSVADANARWENVNIREPIGEMSASAARSGTGGSRSWSGHVRGHFEDGTRGAVMSAAGGSGDGVQGGPGGQMGRFNPVIDDLSRGTVAEDWIPKDIKGQNRMFRIMFARGQIEGPVVETIADMAWSDFDLTGISDPKVLDTYYSAKESVNVERYLPDITKEFLVMGRTTIQMVMHATLGIWVDMLIHDADYIKVTPIPRTGYMPKIDLIPSPEVQQWARSQDPRDMASKKDIPKDLLSKFSQNQPISLDPLVTAYIPRKAYFNDMVGTSFYVRNIPLWGLEKALINATLTGYRRRAGPITHIQVGSETWEPTEEQIDAIVSAFVAAEEDPVSAVIGTLPDVNVAQMRGGSGELWKWSDEWSFLQEAKLKSFGFSEALLSGDATVNALDQAMTIFMERIKAHRAFITEHFLINKFFRAIAHVHGFKRRSEAELKHRIRINEDDQNLQLPQITFHKQLEPVADTTRVELMEKMEEKGIPVLIRDWSSNLGGGDLVNKLSEMKEDLNLRLKLARVKSLRKRIDAIGGGSEEGGGDEGDTGQQPGGEDAMLLKVQELEKEIEKLNFGDSDERPESQMGKSALSKGEEKKADDEADREQKEGGEEDEGGGEKNEKSTKTVASSFQPPLEVIATRHDRIEGSARDDLARMPRTATDGVERDDIRLQEGRLVGGRAANIRGLRVKSGDGNL